MKEDILREIGVNQENPNNQENSKKKKRRITKRTIGIAKLAGVIMNISI